MKLNWLAAVLPILFLGVTGVEIGDLPNLQHQISGTFHVINSTTIFIDDFSYDGLGPATWFYYYLPNTPATSSGGGYKIPLSSEFGQSDGKLKDEAYNNVDVIATMPEGTDVCDIGTFTIWCQPFKVFFTKITIPSDIFENNGVGNCSLFTNETEVIVPPTLPPPEFDNCIPFDDKLQLSWRVHNDKSNVRFKLCGCQSTASSTNQYMGFGLSGSVSATQMLNADATIAWVDGTDGPQATDYYLSAYTQCRDGEGACPDVLDSSGSCTNDAFDVEGSVNDGIQCVSFTRNFSISDSVCDKNINPNNTNQYVVWAVGGLGETAFRHFIRADSSETPIHLGRSSQDQCDGVELTCKSCSPFVNDHMIARGNTTFDVRVGPSGNERGYMGITGRAGWGIAFYINGTLIPELTVERGSTYTFLNFGGKDPDDLSNYHPLYISSSIGGGRLQNSLEKQANETVYAGFDEDGNAVAIGDLCQLSETASSENTRESCSSSLEAYIGTLEESGPCSSGQPGVLVWTPDETTPDLVYYQCATHLNIGWRINVIDKNETAVKPTEEPPTDNNGNDGNDTKNCIPFTENLQLSWTVNYTLSNIRFQLCGCSSGTSGTYQYMGFGLSGSPNGVQMQGADTTLAWVDEVDGPQAVDYYLSLREKCSNGRGACPDVLDLSGSCTNDVFDVEGSVSDGIQCVSFTRNLSTSDSNCDSDIDPSNTKQHIVWAVGRIEDQLALYHSARMNFGEPPIHLGRTPKDDCADVKVDCSVCNTPFVNEKITTEESAKFNVTIGPSGGERGYTAITGLKGSDTAIYVDGTLIPELTLVRGQRYTFTIYGVEENTADGCYPIYITDSINGGRIQSNETIFAGIQERCDNNDLKEICQTLVETESSVYTKELCSTLPLYLDSLTKSTTCGSGQLPTLVWTPDRNTPDLVYYQSPVHTNMGWKINIVGSGIDDSSGTASAVFNGSLTFSFIAVFISFLILALNNIM